MTLGDVWAGVGPLVGVIVGGGITSGFTVYQSNKQLESKRKQEWHDGVLGLAEDCVLASNDIAANGNSGDAKKDAVGRLMLAQNRAVLRGYTGLREPLRLLQTTAIRILADDHLQLGEAQMLADYVSAVVKEARKLALEGPPKE
ncbi:hypothetical protein V3N99_12290 [Dermatophilaceae bacterium Soc4.6]